MKTMLLSAATAFWLTAAMFSTSADAQCLWTGYNWSCTPETGYYYPESYAVSPYPAWNSWDFQDYRLRPGWLPSYPGPKLSGHGGG